MVERRVLIKRLFFPAAILLGTPLLFFNKIGACFFTIWLCSSLLIVDVIPMGITALLPLFIFPATGVLTADEVAMNYFKDGTLLFITTYILALAVEEVQAHRRFALNLLRLSGPKRQWMLLYFLLATTFMSCFISDAAATTVMILIAKSIMETLGEERAEVSSANGSAENGQASMERMSDEDKQFSKALILSSAYASMVGGTGLLTGTSTNLLLNAMLKTVYKLPKQISFVEWMKFSLPFLLLYVAAIYIIIMFMYSGVRSVFTFRARSADDEQQVSKRDEVLKKKIQDLYDELPSVSFGEWSVYFIFGILIAIWIFRDPGFFDGWAALISPEKGSMISDASISVLITAVLFVLPRDPFHDKKWNPIMTWEIMAQKFRWNFFLLFGLGLALADGVMVSGLNDVIACWSRQHLNGVNSFWLQAGLFGVQCVVKEIGVSSFFIPIVLSISKALGLHPFYIGLP